MIKIIFIIFLITIISSSIIKESFYIINRNNNNNRNNNRNFNRNANININNNTNINFNAKRQIRSYQQNKKFHLKSYINQISSPIYNTHNENSNIVYQTNTNTNVHPSSSSTTNYHHHKLENQYNTHSDHHLTYHHIYDKNEVNQDIKGLQKV